MARCTRMVSFFLRTGKDLKIDAHCAEPLRCAGKGLRTGHGEDVEAVEKAYTLDADRLMCRCVQQAFERKLAHIAVGNTREYEGVARK